MKHALVSSLLVVAALTATTSASATGILVGRDGAAVSQPFARVVVVRGETSADVLEQPWPAGVNARSKAVAYLAPVPASVTTFAVVPLGHSPLVGRTAFATQDEGTVVSAEQELDPCAPDTNAGLGVVGGSHAPVIGCGGPSNSYSKELGFGGLRFARPLPHWPTARTVAAGEVASALPGGVQLAAAEAAVVAGWAARGARIVVVRLDADAVPPAIRWSAPGVGPRAPLAIPSTPGPLGGPREVVLDVYAFARLPFAVDGADTTRMSTLELADDGSPLEEAFRATVDAFFSSHATGVLLESAGRTPREASAEILVPMARPPAETNVDVEGSHDGFQIDEHAACPASAAKGLPRKLSLQLDRDGNASLPADTPLSLRACLAPLVARRKVPVNDRHFDIEVSESSTQPAAELPDAFVSRLRVRPGGPSLRLVTGPGSAEEFIARVHRRRLWSGPVTCAQPIRGRFEGMTATGSPPFAALVDTGTEAPATSTAPPPAPPPPRAGPPPTAEPTPAATKRPSSCASLGAGWLVAILAGVCRRSGKRAA